MSKRDKFVTSRLEMCKRLAEKCPYCGAKRCKRPTVKDDHAALSKKKHVSVMQRIVIFCIIVLFFTGCDWQGTPYPMDYVCTSEQLDLVEKEYKICKDTGYLDSYCFAQAKATQCVEIYTSR